MIDGSNWMFFCYFSDIKNEKNVQAVLKDVEGFKIEELHHIDPQVKNILPTKQEIEEEKNNIQS